VVALSGKINTIRRKIAGATVLAIIAASYAWSWETSRGETELTILPLNGGQCVFVDAAGRENDWVIDCGNERAVDSTLKPFLRAHGVNTVRRLALTEGSAMDCAGAKRLDELFGLGELWTSPAHFRSSIYKDIVAGFDDNKRPHKILATGDSTGAWTVLWPATNHFQRADDSALVLLGNFSGNRMLFLSVLGLNVQSELLSLAADLQALIVVARLPHADEPLSE